jgi:pilus assembly protein Flp/PilA
MKTGANGGIPMKSLAKKMQRFLVSEDGPTAVEYAVMLALIVIVCLTAITAVGTKASTTFTNVAGSLGASGGS